MTEIILFRTSGINPSGQPSARNPCEDAGADTSRHFRSLQNPAPAAAEAGSADEGTTDPASCVTAELPVLSGAGQIHGAGGKPAGQRIR